MKEPPIQITGHFSIKLLHTHMHTEYMLYTSGTLIGASRGPVRRSRSGSLLNEEFQKIAQSGSLYPKSSEKLQNTTKRIPISVQLLYINKEGALLLIFTFSFIET